MLFSRINQTAKKENDAFFFRLAEGSCVFTGEQWPKEGLQAVGLLQRHPSERVQWGYHLTITFYDEENHVTAVHEAGVNSGSV